MRKIDDYTYERTVELAGRKVTFRYRDLLGGSRPRFASGIRGMEDGRMVPQEITTENLRRWTRGMDRRQLLDYMENLAQEVHGPIIGMDTSIPGGDTCLRLLDNTSNLAESFVTLLRRNPYVRERA